MSQKVRTGIGQDSHRFLPADSSKPCVIGGIIFEGVPGFNANSDGDVVLHAICNAISSLTGILILGALADDLCLKEHIVLMRQNIARIMKLDVSQVGITATSGEGLTDFGCGDGVQSFAIVTTEEL